MRVKFEISEEISLLRRRCLIISRGHETTVERRERQNEAEEMILTLRRGSLINILEVRREKKSLFLKKRQKHLFP